MKLNSIKTYRRIIQAGVATTFIILPLLNQHGFKLIWGNFINMHVGPLNFTDPLAALQVIIKNQYFPLKLLISSGMILLIAMCLGTVFCSWICPFGLLSESVHILSRRVLPYNFKKLDLKHSGFKIKICVLTAGLLLFVLFFQAPVLNQVSMPSWYAKIFQYLFIKKYISYAVLFVVVVLSAEFIFQKRLWCRYICPQAFLLVSARLVNPFRLKVSFQKEKCISPGNSSPCHKACSLNLDPKTFNKLLETECTNCGDCVDACRNMGGALRFQFKR